MADAANKLVLMAYLGVAGSSSTLGNVGLAVADDGTLIGIGAAEGSRTRVGAGGRTGGETTLVTLNPTVHLVYTPNDTNSHTYTARAINIDNTTRTVYINRSERNDDSPFVPRAVSALTLMEVKV
jgi:hypothetical protein